MLKIDLVVILKKLFENNEWLPCGESVSILDINNQAQSFTLTWKEGDTYFYQRYDHFLKHILILQEDQNSVGRYCIFYGETKLIIDGRYDKKKQRIYK